MKIEEFVDRYSEPYSQKLGIDLASGRNEEFIKWFLESILYAEPIRENSATLTYVTFEAYEVLSVEKILEAGWDKLVHILDEGGYVRYDFSTVTKLLNVFGNFKKEYGSDIQRLYNSSSDSRDLEGRLKALGKGIGETTVSIFLRDMRQVWDRADPRPTKLVIMSMNELGIKDFKRFVESRNINAVRLETALMRLAKDFIKKGKKIEVIL